MEINILHLYYDNQNSYSENGNIKILKKQLEYQGINVNISLLTIDDEINFSKYDFVFIGPIDNQKKVLNHLLKYKNDIKTYIENNKFMLITGSTLNLFGKCINSKTKKHKGLNIFDFEVEEEDFYIIDKCIFNMKSIDTKIIGYQNQNTTIKNINYPLFEVIIGTGSYPKSEYEGIHYKNFYGTYLLGPLLIKNPTLLIHFVKEIIKQKDPNFKIKKFNLHFETKAYNNNIDQINKTVRN